MSNNILWRGSNEEIRDAVETLRFAVEGMVESDSDTPEFREGIKEILNAGENLLVEYFINQSRMADALERIADKKSGWLK